MATFTYLWEFIVAPGRESRFARLYGAEGAWVRLFRTAPGYLGTTLLQAHDRPDRFVTLDRWAGEEAFRRFRRERAAEFAELDALGDDLTLSERLIGEFTEP